ncbi:MAG: TonB-dependent receptor [Sulfurovum sp.]|nr:TonB-dependent receptor [Sulfurovum sp.]
MNKTIKLSMAASMLLIIAVNAAELEPVTVTAATKSEQLLKDVTSNVVVITAEELEEKHYTTVTQALSSVSGISFTSNGGIGQSTSVYLRGFDSKRVLVLIDGVRYNDITGLSGAPFAHLMIHDIERIEIVKGAQSGIWGADASAGVINIVTKSAAKGTHASANVEYGSYNTKKLGIKGSHKTDTYYIQLSSQLIETDGFSAQAPKGSDLDKLEDDEYKNITTNLKFGFNIDETNKIDVSHTDIYAKQDSDPYGNPDGEYNSETNDQFTKINFHHIDSFNTVDIYAARSLFDREYPDDSYTKKFDGEVYEYGLKSNIPYREKDFVILGVDYKSFEHKNDLNKKYNNKAAFITNSNRFGGTIVTESVRFDAYDKFDNKTTGKIGIKHNFDTVDGLSLAANYGTAYNVPTLYNLYSSPYGNPNLNAESTTSYDASIAYKALKLTYFSSDIDEMIDYYDPDGRSGPTPGKYYNIDGTSTLKGCELEYKDKLAQNLLVGVNYTYLNAKDKEGRELARRPKHTFNVGVDYYPTEALQLGLYAKYIGERYDSAGKMGVQTGKYTLVDFVTNYKINETFTSYLKVDNMTDKSYQEVHGYATAGRSFYLGVNAVF